MLPGTNVSWARAINDEGLVAGLAGYDRLFTWREGSGIRDTLSPHVLPNQTPRINNRGQIAGIWRRGDANVPFLWENGSVRELPQPALDYVQAVERLTDGGMLLYRGPVPAGGCPRQAAALFQGQLYDVSSSIGGCWDARDVADGPRIVGSRRRTDLITYFDATAWSFQGETRLPTGRSYFIPTQFTRVGPAGHLAGTQGSGATRMFVLGPGGDYAEFDTPGGPFFPVAISLFGEVVANAYGPPRTVPMLARNGRLIDLTAVGAGFTVLLVSDINRQGHMAAEARLSANGEVHGVLIRPTDQPRNLRQSAAGNHVTLTWDAPPNAPSGATYLLKVGSTPGAADVLSSNLGAATTVSGTVPNGAYFARLVMVYPNGAWSGTSEELRFDVPSPPGAPTGLTFSLEGRRLTLAWTPPAGGAASYVAEAGTQPGASNFYNGGVGSAPGVTAEVPPGTYFIRVRAVSAAGSVGPVSDEIVVTVP
ncbi:MAG: fibronectin type III domain-containing protein [Vicinamibacterales bacterium]